MTKKHIHKFHTSTMFGRVIGEQCGCGLYKMREGSMTLKDEVRERLQKELYVTCSNPPRDMRPEDIGFKVIGIDQATEAIMERVRARVKSWKRRCDNTHAEDNIRDRFYNQALSDLLTELGG